MANSTETYHHCMGPGNFHRVLAVFAVRSASDRAWAYFLPLVLSSIADRGNSSWLLKGSAGLYATRTAVEIAALPLAARFWTGKRKCVAGFLLAENACLIATAWMLFALQAPSQAAAEGQPLKQLAACGVATAIEASVSKTLWNAVEKEQAVVASKGSSINDHTAQLRLAACNAALSRIDLVVGATAPFVVTLLSSSLGVTNTLVMLVCMQILGAIASSAWMIQICGVSAAPAVAEDKAERRDGEEQSSDPKLVIYAHAFLHFTVISDGGLLLVWLRERKIAEATITAFVAAAQICGACGSWIPGLVLRRSGGRLEVAAARVQAAQAAAVVVAAGAVIGGSESALLLSTVLSRAALWGVDLLGRQIVQVRARGGRLRAFALQGSLSQVAACAMYLLAFAGASFRTQCCASASSVIIAAVLLAINARRVEAEDKGRRGL